MSVLIKYFKYMNHIKVTFRHVKDFTLSLFLIPLVISLLKVLPVLILVYFLFCLIGSRINGHTLVS